MKKYVVLLVLVVCYIVLTNVRESMALKEDNLTVFILYTLDDWNEIVKKRIKTAVMDKSPTRHFFIGSSNEFNINDVVGYMNTLDPLDKKYIIYYVENLHTQVNKELNDLFDTKDPIISKAVVTYKAGSLDPKVKRDITIPVK